MDTNNSSADVDLREIFISREEQIEQFDRKLIYWIQYATSANTSGLETPPSPEDQIQGLVVLLTGLSGIGKTTLHKHYYEIARKQSQHGTIQISERIDWEFAVGNKQQLFRPAQRENIDASQYFELIHVQLAKALGKSEADFKKYRATEKEITNAKNQAQRILRGLQQGEEHPLLRSLTVESAFALIRSLPLGRLFLNNNEEIVKIFGNAAFDIGVDKITQMLTHLHQHMGRHCSNYVDAESRSGISLGQDIARFARERPILIFFDTYEEVAEGDKFLRMIMGAAGARVGWVIAGKRPLWKTEDFILGSVENGYGYEELVSHERGMGIDLSENRVGNFNTSDIQLFFTQLYNKVKVQRPSLPTIDTRIADNIYRITLGIPLAVSIAATLYLKSSSFNEITANPEGNDRIVEGMVKRYLKHVRGDKDRLSLYALVLLRRPDEVTALLTALKVPRDHFNEELRRLHRRYGFILTSQEKLALHQEVRHFLRPWLLMNRTNSPDSADIQEIAGRLHSVHYKILKEFEEEHKYTSLRQRLKDERWIGMYLDLTEQEFWISPDEGMNYLLPFMLAASIYNREANHEAQTVGEFFKDKLGKSSKELWDRANQSLVYRASFHAPDEEIHALRELALEIEEQRLTFPRPVQGFRTKSISPQPSFNEVLLAAIWWRLGEAYRVRDAKESADWYRKASEQLPEEKELNEAYEEAKAIYEGLKAIEERANTIEELIDANWHQPEFLSLFTEQGDIYVRLGNYQKARERYTRALEIDNSVASIYAKRGETYLRQRDYRQAISDFELALVIDVSVASVYTKRGEAYLRLDEYVKAIHDFDQALAIEPGNEEILRKKEEACRKRDDEILKEREEDERRIRDATSPTIPFPTVHIVKRRRFLQIALAMGAFTGAIIGSAIWVNHINTQPQPRSTPTPSQSLGGHPLIYSGHRAAVNSVVCSPDGKRMASASDDHTVQVWDASSGNPLFTYRGHSKPVNSVAWSPDGKHIASGSNDQTIQVWNAFSGILLSTCHGHTQGVYSVAWSPDGKHIVSASGDKTVRIWDAFSGMPLSILHGHSQVVWSVAWSPDGRYITSASGDKTVRVWNVSMRKVHLVYRGHTDMVVAVAWSLDGTYIASASYDRTVQVWNGSSGKANFTYRGHTSSVSSVAWSPGGNRITSGGFDQTAQVWDALTGKNVLTYRYPIGAVYSLAWLPDGEHIASAGDDHTVRVWNALAGTTTVTCRDHTDLVWSAIWSPNGKYIASASDDKTVRVWDASKGAIVITYRGHTKATYGLAWSPNGKRIASTSLDTTVQIWDPFTAKLLSVYKGHTGAVRSVMWSPDGKFVASAGDDKAVRVWNSSTGRLLIVYTNHRDSIFSIAWSPDGRHIASASGDKTVQVWDASTGITRTIYRGHVNTVLGIVWSPDGNYIASASLDTTVQIWEALTGISTITYRGHAQAVEGVDWSHDGKYIASASDDTTVQVWDVSTGSNIFIYQKHTNAVNDVAWSPDDTSITSASSDKTVQVWQAPPSLI